MHLVPSGKGWLPGWLPQGTGWELGRSEAQLPTAMPSSPRCLRVGCLGGGREVPHAQGDWVTPLVLGQFLERRGVWQVLEGSCGWFPWIELRQRCSGSKGADRRAAPFYPTAPPAGTG